MAAQDKSKNWFKEKVVEVTPISLSGWDETIFFKVKFNYVSLYLILISISLILIASLRPVGFDRDSLQYLEGFNEFTSLFDADYSVREPSFWLIVYCSKLIFYDNGRLVFLFYAFIYVSISVYSIKRLTPHPFISLFCYVLLFFPLHGMTQIRAGVACAFFLLAIPDIVNRNIKLFLLKCTIASLFHYSAILIFITYIIDPKKINIKIYFLLPFFGLTFAMFGKVLIGFIDNISMYLPSFLSYKINIYLSLLREGSGGTVNLFSFYYFFVLIIYFLSLYLVFHCENKYRVIFCKLLGLSLFLYYLFSSFPIFAVRASEVIGVVVVFLLPDLSNCFKQKIIIICLVFVFVFLTFVNNVFIHNLFNF